MRKIVFLILITTLVQSLLAQGFQVKYGLFDRNNHLIDTTKVLISDSTNFRTDWFNAERPYSRIILHNDTFITLFRNKKIYFVKRYLEIKENNYPAKVKLYKKDTVILGFHLLFAKVSSTSKTGKQKDYEVWYLPDKHFEFLNLGTPFDKIPGLVFVKIDKVKQTTEKVISVTQTVLPPDIFSVPRDYKKFK